MSEQLLTVIETAGRLSISISGTRRLIYSGELAALKVRGSLRVRQADIDKYIEKQQLDFEDEWGLNNTSDEKKAPAFAHK